MKKANRKFRISASSMRLRLYAFLSMLIVLLVLVVFLGFYIFGSFPQGISNAGRFAEREFDRLYSQVSEQFGDITVQLVSLSQSLSRSIEFQLAERNIQVQKLNEHPEVLEELISGELGRLLYALERTDASGVYMVLDATINPELKNSENSRAGMYIRISEPQVSGAATATYNYFRGFAKIAYQNDLNIMVKWDMEFDVGGRSFYHNPINESRSSSLPLSKLYYWSMDSIVPGLDDVSVTCSIPLIDSAGEAFGVCGFDISEWNFNTRYLPDSSEYRYVASIFGSVNDDLLNTNNAFVTGRYSLVNMIRSNGQLLLPEGNGLRQYEHGDGSIFYGMHNEANLYPHDSPFSEQEYALALLILKSEIDAINNREIIQLVIICIVLLVLGLAVSFIAGRRYLSPIESALNAIRAGNLDSVKTNIVELDQLVEEMKTYHDKDRPFPDDFFSDFIKRVGTLSPVEKKILDYFIDSAADKEIISALFITKDALKKHSERIYKKLGVSGKEALMLYVELMKMSGQTDKITNH